LRLAIVGQGLVQIVVDDCCMNAALCQTAQAPILTSRGRRSAVGRGVSGSEEPPVRLSFMAAQSTSVRRQLRQSRLLGNVEARTIAARVGATFRDARRARRLTQSQVGQVVGVHQSRISQLELGRGLGSPMGLWIAVGLAVGSPMAVGTSRSIDAEPRDAGHLAPQETNLRLAREHGVGGTFELPTRPAPNAPSIDVGLHDNRHRTLTVVEIWNRLDDLGAGVRSFNRKLLEAGELAVNAGGDGDAYRVAGCWVLRATAANRRLVARYPSIFAAQFTGSSRAWVRTLTTGAPAPTEAGMVWIDLAGKRVFEVRRAHGTDPEPEGR
jgi:hypothetical protein